jgi:hypothetical protein
LVPFVLGPFLPAGWDFHERTKQSLHEGWELFRRFLPRGKTDMADLPTHVLKLETVVKVAFMEHSLWTLANTVLSRMRDAPTSAAEVETEVATDATDATDATGLVLHQLKLFLEACEGGLPCCALLFLKLGQGAFLSELWALKDKLKCA